MASDKSDFSSCKEKYLQHSDVKMLAKARKPGGHCVADRWERSVSASEAKNGSCKYSVNATDCGERKIRRGSLSWESSKKCLSLDRSKRG